MIYDINSFKIYFKLFEFHTMYFEHTHVPYPPSPKASHPDFVFLFIFLNKAIRSTLCCPFTLGGFLTPKHRVYKELYPPSSSREGTPYFSSWSSDRGVIHVPITSEVMVSAGISSGSILLTRV